MNSDVNIIEGIQKGDFGAFENLFRKYHEELCNYAFQFFSDKDTVQEIVQDLFYKLWQKRDSITIHTSIRAYLYRAVYNNTLQVLREKNSLQSLDQMGSFEQRVTDDYNSPLQVKELNIIIQRTLKSMPDKVREIFEMSRFDGLKYREIAELLSISVKTVEANMGRALKLFRKNLKDYVDVI